MPRQAVLRRNVSARDSYAQARLAIRMKGPNFGQGSNIGPFSKAIVAAKNFAAKALAGVPVGEIATAAGVSKETAKNWKLGKRMPNGEAMLDLQTNLRAVRDYSKRRWDGHESPQIQQAIAQAEHAFASLTPEQREAALAQFKQQGLT